MNTQSTPNPLTLDQLDTVNGGRTLADIPVGRTGNNENNVKRAPRSDYYYLKLFS